MLGCFVSRCGRKEQVHNRRGSILVGRIDGGFPRSYMEHEVAGLALLKDHPGCVVLGITMIETDLAILYYSQHQYYS